MKLINRKHTGTKQKRANMQYITHIYPHPIIIENSYFLENESFLPCIFRIVGFPIYSIYKLKINYASKFLEA